MENELGLRNVAFEVDDLQTTVHRLVADGTALSRHRSGREHLTHDPRAWPGRIIVSLAERIG
jgi:hypothetical protein